MVPRRYQSHCWALRGRHESLLHPWPRGFLPEGCSYASRPSYPLRFAIPLSFILGMPRKCAAAHKKPSLTCTAVLGMGSDSRPRRKDLTVTLLRPRADFASLCQCGSQRALAAPRWSRRSLCAAAHKKPSLTCAVVLAHGHPKDGVRRKGPAVTLLKARADFAGLCQCDGQRAPAAPRPSRRHCAQLRTKMPSDQQLRKSSTRNLARSDSYSPMSPLPEEV
ncbi:hypothetical protein CTEST_00535 [Corynebacterium testudinoris]|uniref:Uncharacterized protein n=1 Tax=Corynebacterium testudinoris TaxID=136857 RepID=A0A0G3H8S2_9CORY|nr:hypothetical protein CTEST_00535 [Corynebacterium testudinoris]